MRIFPEMPNKYIVREIDTHQPTHRIRFDLSRNMPTSDVHYAWVVGGEQFAKNMEAGVENKSANPQPIPSVIRDGDNFVIEISKHEKLGWYLEQFIKAGVRFVYLQINDGLCQIPLDRLELESSTEI